ncbi:MAG: methyltransferase [Hydrotalea flava]|nr:MULTISPECIES: methyltransferase [Hydrotalea]MBY0347413.1 methyltransferase [Hydrotalea flava]NIM38331.1 methyltransferase [Hydrotalea flava]NIN15189.1 methyltransferase [Hydrotalea flava]NIO94257.1 methyltransferase [Hydrotalea flava]NIQ50659.1 methyltransferase [Hydrotalea flava]
MKTCTDACLFGAFMAQYISNNPAKTIADIGTGTGLLSLMIAQKNEAIIHAYEIDEGAAMQAKENFSTSPWYQRLTVIKGNVIQLQPATTYEWLVCNPPFYEKSLKSPQVNKNIAMHSEQLRLQDLLPICNQFLNQQGRFALLLPYQRTTSFIAMAHQNNFYLEYKLDVKPSPKHHIFRTICIFSKAPTPTLLEEMLTIKELNNAYSEPFTALLKDYYQFL